MSNITVKSDGSGITVAAQGPQGAQGTPGTASLTDQIQVIYVSKAGSNGNSGLNLEAAKLTITAAIASASAMTPSVSNQVAIQIVDSGNYVESFTLPEWVHINGLNADVDGTIDLDDNCIIRLRRLANSGVGECISKINGSGLSKVQADIMFVSASGNTGIAVKNGQLGCTIGTVFADGGTAFLVRAGSRLVFDIQYMNLANSGRGFLTSTTGGTGNVINGNILLVDDDGSGRFIRTVVDGDVLDIQGGSFLVNQLYDLGLNAVLNLFAHITTGSRSAVASAQINIVDTSGDSNLQGDLSIEGTLSGPTIEAKLENGDNVSELVNDAGYLTSAPVASVNTKTGVVVLDADDISDAATANKYTTAAEISKLAGIAALAEVNTINSGDNVSDLVNDAGYITNGLQSGDDISELTNDVPYLSQATTGTVFVSSLSALSQFLNGSVYELPAGRYDFTASVDFGTATISLEDTNGCYNFIGACLPLISYSGTSSFITSPTTGIIIQLCGLFITTPNATCVELTNGNSVIMNIAVLFNCQLGLDIDTFDFVTLIAAPIIGCDDGIQATNVKTITARLPQYNGGANVGGSYLTALGASSERIIMSTIDSRPESSESFLNIDATYGGDVSLGVGVHKTGGGVFFDASGRDQTDVDIEVQDIKNVADSGHVTSAHFTGNSTVTTISVSGTPVKIAATWTDILSIRFSFNANGTWTYTGKEDVSINASVVATLDVTGGGTKTTSLYLAKNGTFIPTSKGEAAGSAASQVGAVALIPMVTGDTIECFVANESDTNNITVTTASFNAG